LLLLAAVVGSAPARASRAFPTCLAVDVCATVSVIPGIPPFAFPTIGGTGSGTVVSTPAGINCTMASGFTTGTCSKTFAAPIGEALPAVTLTVTPSPGNTECFPLVSGPTNGIPGSVDYCNNYADYAAGGPLTTEVANLDTGGHLDAGTTVTWKVYFALTLVNLTVTTSGPGTGTVTSPGDTIICGTRGTGCGEQTAYGKPVTLTATPDAGATFSSWAGACSGQGPTCTLTPKAAVTTSAAFGLAGETSSTSATTTTTSASTTTRNPTTPGNHSPEAQLLGARCVKNTLGLREAEIEVQTEEPLRAALALSRDRKPIARKTILAIHPGDHVLILPVPRSATRGKATLTLTLTNKTSNHATFSRTVAVPR
jgi:hypothetical protein